MSHRFAFLDPTTLFAILRECAPAGARFTFARYGPLGEGVGLFPAELDDSATNRYLHGGFSEVLVTLGMVPRDATDWKFIERASRELIHVEGCRTKGDLLEICTIRCLARDSLAAPLFARISRRIRKSCRKGMRVIGTQSRYPQTWYDPALIGRMELRQSLDDPDQVYEPLPEGT